MSYQTPSRSRSSLGYYATNSSTSSLNRAGSNSSSKAHVKVAPDLRRPPSSRNSMIGGTSSPQPRSRPGSAMGYFSNPNSNSSSSRPPTPSFLRSEPFTGSITVSIRPNPYSVNTLQAPVWELNTGVNSISNKQDLSSFVFDNVFPVDMSTTNYAVYQKSCSPIVDKFLSEGYNGTVFAYGMTGSGKTFSMRGDQQDPGFVKLAIDDIFKMLDSNSMTSQREYKLNVTYLEIYNEKIIDLLASSPGSNSSSDLKIRDDATYGNTIVGITSPIITSKDQILQLIKRGDNNRKTSATDFNARSSRSHSILQIKLNVIDLASNNEQHSVLSLCDLAGSERATSSLERRKEGAYINKSLLALSTVINKLSVSSSNSPTSLSSMQLQLQQPPQQLQQEHIPYRDSKLTRLLQPALSGSSLISILCTIHLGSANDQVNSINNQFISETYNTLRFAARARNIVMNVDKNRFSSTFSDNADTAKLVDELRRTIESQKNELQLLKSLNRVGGSAFSSIQQSSDSNTVASIESDLKMSQLDGENKILNEKLEHLTRLTDLQKTETIILKNDILNDMLGSGIDNNALQVMMANLEEFYKRINYEMDEYKSYINHLENQLKYAHTQNSLNGPGVQSTTKPSTTSATVGDLDLEAVLKDQEEEIWHLKELINDKDHIIKSLTKTSKLRRLMESNSANLLEKNANNAGGDIKNPTARVSEGRDKENNAFGELKSFKIGGRPPSPEKERNLAHDI